MPGKFRKTFVIILHRKKDLWGVVGGVQPVSKPNRRLVLWKTPLQEVSSILQMAADRKKERKKEHRTTTMQKSANEEEYVRVLHIAQKTAKNTKPLPRCRSLQMKMKK